MTEPSWSVYSPNDSQGSDDIIAERSDGIKLDRTTIEHWLAENTAYNQTVDALALRFDCEPSEVYYKVMEWKNAVRDVLEEWEWLRKARPIGGDFEGTLASHQAFLEALWPVVFPSADD